MPAPQTARRGPWAVLLLAATAGLGGCAAPGGGTPAMGLLSGAASPSVLAVRAFTQLCGSLQTEAVAQRAETYAFVPLEAAPRTDGIVAELHAKGLRGWIRPVSGSPALLTWSEQGRSCELAVGGIEVGEVEREFAAMAGRLERNGLAVTRLRQGAEGGGDGPLRLRQAMVVTPRGLAPGQPRVIAMRASTDPAQALQAVLTMRPLVLPALVRPDDAIPVEQ